MSGTSVPFWNLVSDEVPPPGPPDSDRDTMPNGVDPYPLNFDNQGLDDSQTNNDVDEDGITDYPTGADHWLNTTIQNASEFPAEFRGKQVSIYIGPTEKPVVTGEDTIRIFIDLKEGFFSGYYLMGDLRDAYLFADYLIEIKGKDGRILDASIYEYNGDNYYEWNWISLGSPDIANDLHKMELSVGAGIIPWSSNAVAVFFVDDWEGSIDSGMPEDVKRIRFSESTKTAGSGWTQWSDSENYNGVIYELIASNIDEDTYREVVGIDWDLTASGANVAFIRESDGTNNNIPTEVWRVDYSDATDCPSPSALNYCQPYQGVAVGDSDDDGKQEVIVANWSTTTNAIRIYEYSGSGGLSGSNPSTTPTTTLTPDEPPQSVVVGDQDGDGNSEIYVGFGARNNAFSGCSDCDVGLNIFETTGDDTYSKVWTYKWNYGNSNVAGVRTVKVGNSLDGDGDAEFVFGLSDWLGPLGFRVLIYENTGDDTYAERYNVSVNDIVNALEVFDIDSDGDQEVFVATNDGTVSLIYWGGSAYQISDLGGVCGFGEAKDVDAVKDEGTSNVDNDGYLEVFVACGYDYTVQRGEYDGSGFASTDFDWYTIFTSDDSSGIFSVVALGIEQPNPRGYDNDNYFDVFAGEGPDAANDELFVVEYNTVIPEFHDIVIPIASIVLISIIIRKRKNSKKQE
jgi:hypothetical protein